MVDVVEAIPTLFGFTPAESFVAIVSSGPRHRYGFPRIPGPRSATPKPNGSQTTPCPAEATGSLTPRSPKPTRGAVEDFDYLFSDSDSHKTYGVTLREVEDMSVVERITFGGFFLMLGGTPRSYRLRGGWV